MARPIKRSSLFCGPVNKQKRCGTRKTPRQVGRLSPDVALPKSEPDLEDVTSRRLACEPPSPRNRAVPPLPSCAPPSGRPRADLRSPAVARCCGLGAKAPHATPPPCPRPPGLGAPPAIAWDSACDRSLAAASSPAGVAVSPPPASPWIVRWRSPAWPNAPRVCLRERARSLGGHIHLPAPMEIGRFAPAG